jgi:hypothetical protein
MIGQRTDGDIADGIDPIQKLAVYPEHAALVSNEQHLPLGWLRIMCTFYGRHGRHSSGAVILMDFTGMFLPDENMLLANTKHMRNISRLNNMAPLEGNTLETIIHFGDIMA